MTVRVRKRKSRYLLIAILIFVLFVVSLLFVPIDITNSKDLIVPKIESALNLRVDTERLIMTILPYPRLSLKKFTVQDDAQVLLKAKSMNASLSLLSLLFQKTIEMKSFVIVEPELFIKREKDGRFSLLKHLKGAGGFPISIKKLRLKKGRAHFIDESYDEKMSYEATDIDISLIPRGAVEIAYSGSLVLLPSTSIRFSGSTKDVLSVFEGELELKNVSLGRHWPYARYIFSPGLQVSMDEGYADVSFRYSKAPGEISLKGTVKYTDVRAAIPALFRRTVHSTRGLIDMEISSKSGLFRVNVSNAEIHLPEFGVFASLTFDGSKRGKGALLLDLRTTSIPLASVKEQFFVDLLPEYVGKDFADMQFVQGEVILSGLKLSGDIQDIKTERYYNTPGSLEINAELKDAEFTHRAFDYPFSMVSGGVRWKDGDIHADNVGGLYGKTVIDDVDGSIASLLGDAPLVKLKGYSLAEAGEIVEEVKQKIGQELRDRLALDKLSVEGSVSLFFDIEGSLGTPERNTKRNLSLSYSADITSSGLSYSSWLRKEKGFPVDVEAQILLTDERIALEKGRVGFGTSAVDIKGTAQFGEGAWYEANIVSQDLKIDDVDTLLPALKKEFASKGNVTMDLRISQKGERKLPLIKGGIYLKDAEFETRLFPKKIENINISARLYGNSAIVKIDKIKVGSSDLAGSINISDIENRGMEFSLTSLLINTDDVYYQGERGAIVVIPVFGKGKISAKEAKFFGFHVQDFRADVVAKPEYVVAKTAFVSNKGKVRGDIRYSQKDDEEELLRIAVESSNVEAEPFLWELGASEKILTGKVDVKMELSVRKGEEDFLKRMNGKGIVNSKNGKLWKFIVLSKIFSIVNILSIDELFRQGLPYKTVAGDFVIKDGVVSTENLVLDSSSMRMSGIGTIDMPRMTIDAKLGLHPFVTVDKIISKIPLAGWIIGGKEKSTLSMYYKISGPLKDPEVEAIPVTALGEGILGIFKRTLGLPFRPFIKDE